MSHLFISYSKKDFDFARHLREQLHDAGFAVWMDDKMLRPAEKWWPTIENNIVTCAAFIVIMSPNSLASDWVERETLVAENAKHRKPIFPILLEGEGWTRLGNIEYEDMRKGLKADLSYRFIEALSQYAPKFTGSAPPPLPPDTLRPLKTPPKQGCRFPINTTIAVALIGLIGTLGAALIAALPGLLNSPTPTLSLIAPSMTLLALSNTFVPTATVTATLDVVAIADTLDAQAAAASATQRTLDQTATATLWTPIPTPNVTATIDAFRTRRAIQHALDLTATATLWTNTPTPNPVDAALERARTFGGSNDDWKALYPAGFTQAFDGVPMALVPAGCFTIGANPKEDDEQNGNRVCFDQPFWLDLTEMTQADFDRLGGVKAQGNGFDGARRPVENITWFEARDFCAQRSARLPTEAEWEYAARGPSDWDYPWGDAWDAAKAVWNRSNQGTADVGSIAAGASWVGAQDMSGNVWEWTGSLYQSYPYRADDGREADSGDRTDVQRVLRGGSWNGYDPDNLRAAIRLRLDPVFWSFDLGFRCARSLD